MVDSLEEAEEAVVSLVASSKEEVDKAAVVEHQAGRTWIVRARVEVVKAHPAAAATGQLVGALTQSSWCRWRCNTRYIKTRYLLDQRLLCGLS